MPLSFLFRQSRLEVRARVPPRCSSSSRGPLSVLGRPEAAPPNPMRSIAGAAVDAVMQ